MAKYIVLSHDPDAQTFYHDFVIARNADDAEDTVLQIRDYCTAAEAIDLRTLRTHYAALSKWSNAKVEASWQKIVRAHKPNECDKLQQTMARRRTHT
jgi:hypothetical protein